MTDIPYNNGSVPNSTETVSVTDDAEVKTVSVSSFSVTNENQLPTSTIRDDTTPYSKVATTSNFTTIVHAATEITDETTDIRTREITDTKTRETTYTTTTEKPSSVTTTIKAQETTDTLESEIESEITVKTTHETTDIQSNVTATIQKQETTDIQSTGVPVIKTQETTGFKTYETKDTKTRATTDVITRETTDMTTYETISETTDISGTETTDIMVQETTNTTYGYTSDKNMDNYSSEITSSTIPNTKGFTRTSDSKTMVTSGSTVWVLESSTSTAAAREPCDDVAALAAVAIVSTILMLVILFVSVIGFLRMRNKWRAKIQYERKRTDIWSLATFNNTIINENFGDFELALPKPDARKSSGFSETSVRVSDQFSGSAPYSQFSFDNEIVTAPVGVLEEFNYDNTTLRRNTYSAPGGLNAPVKGRSKYVQDSPHPNDKKGSLRDRSSTFTAGKKHKNDRRVLLSHEEIIDNNGSEQFGDQDSIPTQSFYVTEL